MPHGSLSDRDYKEAGRLKGLELVGYAPVDHRDVATWRCVYCGATHHKSIRAVRKAVKGCNCQNADRLTAEDYHALAQSLDLVWVGKIVPKRSKDHTRWVTPSGQTLSASYHHLKHRMSDKIRKWIKDGSN